ncbi:MAG TPA: TlpA disulfide reductase family protein [Chitinophagales bacterium]|nr:TlpA disulfide reductase family protein [Chitinophagales bacterium]
MFMLYVILTALWAGLADTPKVREISLEQLQTATLQNNDTLYVVNFWATWCKPCVAEMPYFEEAATKFAGQKVKVIFVSLNYPREIASVDKFVKQKKIESDCYVLNAGNPNVWIDKVEKEWGGSIPATLLYKNGKKIFFREGEFTQTELDSIIKSGLQ